MRQIRRTVRNTGIKIVFNNQDDFLVFDYKMAFHHEESKVKVDEAIDRLYDAVQKILEDDRAMLKQSEDDLGK